jgi:hypothetical protein
VLKAVVDLPVDDEDVARLLLRHGLMPCGGEIDYCETALAKPRARVTPGTFIIWPTTGSWGHLEGGPRNRDFVQPDQEDLTSIYFSPLQMGPTVYQVP